MPRIRVEEPKNYVFQTEIPVRISEINYGGHLGHDAVLPITHEARVRFLSGLDYTELDFGGFGIVISGIVIEYLNETFFGDIYWDRISSCVARTEAGALLAFGQFYLAVQ